MSPQEKGPFCRFPRLDTFAPCRLPPRRSSRRSFRGWRCWKRRCDSPVPLWPMASNFKGAGVSVLEIPSLHISRRCRTPPATSPMPSGSQAATPENRTAVQQAFGPSVGSIAHFWVFRVAHEKKAKLDRFPLLPFGTLETIEFPIHPAKGDRVCGAISLRNQRNPALVPFFPRLFGGAEIRKTRGSL